MPCMGFRRPSHSRKTEVGSLKSHGKFCPFGDQAQAVLGCLQLNAVRCLLAQQAPPLWRTIEVSTRT